MLAFLAAALLTVAPPLTPVSPRLVTVTADSRLTFPANQVTLTLRLSARDKDERVATKAGEEKQRKLLDALHAAGADPRWLLPMPNGVQAEYRGNEVIAQVDTRTVVVVATDMSKVDPLLTAATKQGAVIFGALMFAHTDQAPFELKVRTQAAAQARERATAMVEGLGGKLGLPRVVTDQSQGNPATAQRYAVTKADGTVSSGATAVELSVMARLMVQFDVRDEG